MLQVFCVSETAKEGCQYNAQQIRSTEMTIINDVMRLMRKILFNLGLFVGIVVLLYAFYLKDHASKSNSNVTLNSTDFSTISGSYTADRKTDPTYTKTDPADTEKDPTIRKTSTTELTREIKRVENINLCCIFTKVDKNSILKDKFAVFAKSVLDKATEPIVLSVITDKVSRPVAEGIIGDVQNDKRFHEVAYLDVSIIAEKLERVVSIMSPHFSSKPGTYYSDALFFLSLGLHHIIGADDQQKVIMTDVDIKVVGDIAELWTEFDKFSSNAIFGLGPELSPVYRHVFHSYRASNPGTTVGEPFSENGYSGVNSGVILLNLARMRQSKIYAKFIGDDVPGNTKSSGGSKNMVEGDVSGRVTSVDSLVKKYLFKGHLGDQDFYTLLGAEYPELIHIIPCVWNRQLCTWWGDRGGYGDVFNKYFKCDGKVKIYHGNCNSPFPDVGD
ncbi:xyloside xylosyltransferase 1-like [Hetaerina americana]|uniref:xyloside xylosyltransferase 1-like n=1 Tax=Hetaerina americana TaxID=62018 RepID=UPI003A7F5ABE